MAKKKSLPKTVLNSKPKDWRWIPYHMCKELTNMAGIKSFREYRAWVRDYKPGGIPTRPELKYVEWVDWPTFLETDNVYLADSPGAVRNADLLPYWDAVAKVQKLNLNTTNEYYEAFDAGRIPEGIPRQPHLRYPVFYVNGAWKVWLGKGVKHRVVASQNLQKLFVLYRTVGRSSNVISVMIHGTGIGELRKQVSSGLDVVKIYLWKDADAEQVFPILDYYGKPQGDDISWLFSNTNEMLYQLDNVLDLYREDNST